MKKQTEKKAESVKRNIQKSRRLLERSILLDEQEGPPLLRGVLLFGTFIVAVFIVWASFAQLEEIEKASGEIVPADESIKIQHPTGGLIVDLAVREGMNVRKGQVLVQMDQEDYQSIQIQTKARLLALYAQKIRLEAELYGKIPDYSTFPKDGETFAADQSALFDASKYQRSIAKQTSESQIQQAKFDNDRIAARIESVQRQLVLASEDTEVTKKLVDRGTAPRTDLLAKLRTQENVQEQLDSLKAEKLRAQERIDELTIKQRETEAVRITKARDDLSQINEQISQSEMQAKRADLSAGRLVINSPVNGVVHALNYLNTGMIVAPGATIMQILPEGQKQKARVRIDPKSIGSLKIGDTARIKVSAYPHDKYGAFNGILRELSASTFIMPDGRPYYTGAVEILGREIPNSTSLTLLPGMTVEAEFRTGQKTLIKYLLKPIYSSAREAFREK